MIRTELTGELCLLWLARPDKANALTGAMLTAIGEAVTLAAQQGAKALVICGEGKVFSAGADLEEMKAGLGTSPAWNVAVDAIARFPGLELAT